MNFKMNCEIDLNGSKSFTNRALILAAQAQGETILINSSISKDTGVLIEGLRKLGIEIEAQGNLIKVNRKIESFESYKGEIDIGMAGTSIRFLSALVAAVPKGEVVLTGTKRMQERPISDLVDALLAVGVKVEYLGKQGCPPIKVYGQLKQTSTSIRISAATSSQFLTAMLLAAPSLASYFEVNVEGEVVSSSYIDMTLYTLKQFGINVVRDGYSYFLIAKTEPKAGRYFIDGDASGACYFWSLAAAFGGRIRVNNLNINSPQGDLLYLKILEKMGCKVSSGETSGVKWIEVQGYGKVTPVQEDLTLFPDSAQTLAVLCALADGVSHITGLGTLKHKETDRLQALQNELAKVNIKTEIGSDFIKVYGGTLKFPDEGIEIATYEDHRMAMSFALLTILHKGVKIQHPEEVGKSFPDFWEKFAKCTWECL